MSHRPLHALADHEVLPRLAELVARDRATTAEMLALLGRAGARRLAAATPYPSLFRYCVGALGMSEDMAWKRIRAARAARRHPAILVMVADGRLHLTTVVRLAPHLTRENAAELLAAAAGRSRREVELLLAERFPRPEVVAQEAALETAIAAATTPACGAMPAPLEPAPTPTELVPEPVAPASACAGPACETALVPEPVRAPRGRVTPVGPGRFSVEFECGAGAETKLRRAHALLAHAVPGGALPEVFERALDALTEKLEKRRYAATDRPRVQRPPASANPRHIPAAVRREVRERDGDRCTFESADGQRCEERGLLEYDHVIPWLRTLGVSVAEARRAAATCEALPDAPLEARVRHALKRLAPPSARTFAPVTAAPA